MRSCAGVEERVVFQHLDDDGHRVERRDFLGQQLPSAAQHSRNSRLMVLEFAVRNIPGAAVNG